MVKTADQGEKWGISRKNRPVFPMEKKHPAKKILSTEGNIKLHLFSHVTIQVYRCVYSSIYRCVIGGLLKRRYSTSIYPKRVNNRWLKC